MYVCMYACNAMYIYMCVCVYCDVCRYVGMCVYVCPCNCICRFACHVTACVVMWCTVMRCEVAWCLACMCLWMWVYAIYTDWLSDDWCYEYGCVCIMGQGRMRSDWRIWDVLTCCVETPRIRDYIKQKSDSAMFSNIHWHIFSLNKKGYLPIMNDI